MRRPREKAELRFLINDGTVICQGSFFPTTTVEELKQYLMDMWPQEQSIIPKNVEEIKLIFNGKFLKDERTLFRSGLLSNDFPGGVITIHVAVQPPPPSDLTDESPESFVTRVVSGCCSCTIL